MCVGGGGRAGDSEGELQDQTPDTDDSGAHSYPELSSAAPASFKRAPNMGKGVLEQRGKKSRTYPPKDTANTGTTTQNNNKVCKYAREKNVTYIYINILTINNKTSDRCTYYTT